MADEKLTSVTVNTVESHQDDDEATQSTTPQQWPVEPGSLVADRQYDIFMTVYDSFLCAIPLFLIAKTSLCIYAHNLDKYHSGYTIDAVSRLTIFLLNFNDQVSLRHVLPPLLASLTNVQARHCLHDSFRYYHVHPCQTTGSLQSTAGSDCL